MVAITPLPTPPSTDDPANFDARADAFLGALPAFVAEANGYGAALAADVTGAVSIPYIFSTTTADADPTSGQLRLNNAMQNAATVIRADLLDALGTDVTAVLDSTDDSGSAVKGQIRLSKVGDGAAWLLFNVTAVASPSGYRNITVALIGSSAASPLADGDPIVLSFTRTGDVGPTGTSIAWTLLSTQTISGSPSTVTFSSISSSYCDLAFEFDAVSFSVTTTPTVVVSADGITFSSVMTLIAASTALTGEIRVNGYRRSIGSLSAALSPTATTSPTIVAATPFQGTSLASAAFRVAGGISAIRFLGNGTTFSGGVIRLYGR